jgi:hypothetical protein
MGSLSLYWDVLGLTTDYTEAGEERRGEKRSEAVLYRGNALLPSLRGSDPLLMAAERHIVPPDRIFIQNMFLISFLVNGFEYLCDHGG